MRKSNRDAADEKSLILLVTFITLVRKHRGRVFSCVHLCVNL